MTSPIFGDTAIRAASYALDGLSARQKVTAQNIANVDTPGYKALEVDFETQLGQALNGESTGGLAMTMTDANHIGIQTTSATEMMNVEPRMSDLRNDSNNVNIDVEMSTLAETSLRYQALAQLAGAKVSLIKRVISSIS